MLANHARCRRSRHGGQASPARRVGLGRRSTAERGDRRLVGTKAGVSSSDTLSPRRHHDGDQMTAESTSGRTRAVGLYTFGDTDVLGVVERPVPEVGEGEVRIRVQAAAVNPTDLGFRSGARAETLAAFDAPYVPGMDAAGTV